jgi:hypothetical protein
MMQRRQLIKAMAAIAGASAVTPPLLAQAKVPVEVWKDPDCGCCKDWVTHLEANGFQVRVHDSGNVAARIRLGIPAKLGSCHTAEVVSVQGKGYALEGHVPARDIHRLLKERPQAIGLAVPGMPVGSPGMDGPIYGGRKDPYDVMLVNQGGSSRVYQSYHRG